MQATLLLPLCFAIIVIAAMAQTVTGFGFSMVAVPLLALLVDPVIAITSATTTSLLLTAEILRREHQHIDRPIAKRMILTGILGMPIGLVLISVLPSKTLVQLVACTIVILVSVTRMGLRLPQGRSMKNTSGFLSGTLLTCTGMGGAPLVLALQSLETPPRPFRVTLQAIFFFQGIIAVVAFAVLGHLSAMTMAILAISPPGLALGWLIGNNAFSRLDARRFEWIVSISLLAMAVTMILGS